MTLPHTSSWHHITPHQATWHETTSHQVTSHDMTSSNQPRYLTSHHLTSNRIYIFLISQPTTWRHTTSHHSTSHHHHRHATKTQPATTNHGLKAGAREKLGLGIALAGDPARILWASIGKLFRWLIGSFRPETSTLRLLGSTWNPLLKHFWAETTLALLRPPTRPTRRTTLRQLTSQ